MEGLTSKKLPWHPSDGDLVTQLDGQSGWAFSLRVRIHLRRCRNCALRTAAIEKHLTSLSPTAGEQELRSIRRNLMEAIRAYEQVEPAFPFQPAPEMRRTLEEYLGGSMAAQFAERAATATDSRTAYGNVDRTLRLLLGGKAAASLKAKILQGPAR